MLYGHGTCLLVGEEYVLLLEKNICLLVGEEYMVSSCWRRIYGYGRCLLVGEEYILILIIVLIIVLDFCYMFVFNCVFIFWNSTKSISSRTLHPLTISDDSI